MFLGKFRSVKKSAFCVPAALRTPTVNHLKEESDRCAFFFMPASSTPVGLFAFLQLCR
jgi:hypothetical protein